jgi:hypothetical protein
VVYPRLRYSRRAMRVTRRQSLLVAGGSGIALLGCEFGEQPRKAPFASGLEPTPARAVQAQVDAGPAAVLVLSFEGNSRPIEHPDFWLPSADLGKFWWDAWVRPDGPGYLWGDGLDGAASLALGFEATGDATYGKLVGHLLVGGGLVQFSAAEPIPWGDWMQVTLTGDGSFVRLHVHGICVGEFPYAGPRVCRAKTPLWVGGCRGKPGFKGAVAWLRAWDSDVLAVESPERTFIPTFSPRSEFLRNGEHRICDFLADYTVPRDVFPDLSPRGVRGSYHPGCLAEAPADVAALPAPKWVPDASGPFVLGGQGLGSRWVPAPVAAPPTALVWDTFARGNQTYASHDVPSLGETDGGSLGRLKWKAGSLTAAPRPASWGILHGSAVYLLEQPGGIAWVDTGRSDYRVSLKRKAGATVSPELGLCFRVKDQKSFGFLTVSSKGVVTAFGFSNGVRALFDQHFETRLSKTEWSTAAIVCRGDDFQVYVDDDLIAELRGTNEMSALRGGTGCGLFSSVGAWGAQTSLTRYEQFRVDPV